MRKVAKWKPKKCFNEECMISCYPYPMNKIGIMITNEDESRHIFLWLPVKEAEEFGKAILEQTDRANRITGIRTAEFAQRWC